MKKILLFVTSVMLCYGINAQFYSENFEAVSTPALPSGWTQVTVATDGGYQTSTNMTSTYFDFPAHTTYVGTNDDICNCDKANEELISNDIILTSGSFVLSFEYVHGSYYGETAEVGISANGVFTQLSVLSPTNSNGPHAWTSASFDISAYAGQTINIVWIYHDNSNWGSGLMIDDVVISQPLAVDMEMTNLTTPSTVGPGPTNITGTVTSNSSNNITSLDISWDDGSGANSQSFAVNLNYGDTYNFTHGTPLNATGGQTYNIDVTVTANGDSDASNDMLSTTISAVSSIVPKIVVGEEKTGEWCGWCPRGSVALANMALSNPNDFIGIAVHNGDGMAVSSYDGNIGNYIPGGYPGGGVDRVLEGDPSDFLTMYNARKSNIPPASIIATGTYNATSIDVEIKANFVGALTGDYRLAAVLLEDSVIGANQSNFYSGGGAGQLSMPNIGSMPGYNFATGPQSISGFAHDHVAIALGDNEINGTPGSLPASVSDGDTQTHTYTFNRNPSWNVDKIHVVGMLVNGSTGEILNAGKGKIIDFNTVGTIETINSNNSVKIYPNPTKGIINLFVNMEEKGNVDINVVNVLGEIVYKSQILKNNTGEFSASFDMSDQAEGMYMLYFYINGKHKVIRFNIVK